MITHDHLHFVFQICWSHPMVCLQLVTVFPDPPGLLLFDLGNMAGTRNDVQNCKH